MRYGDAMMGFSRRFVAAAWIVGYSQATATASPSTPDDSHFALVVGGELKTANGGQPLVQASVVHANDELTFTIWASRPVNVFVAYCDSHATQQVYGPLLAGPGAMINIPTVGSFMIDDNAGLEHVFVVASAEALQVADPRLDRNLRKQGGERPCADALAMTTEESHRRRADEGRASAIASPPPPARASLAGTAPRRIPRNYPTAARPFRIRGMNPHEGPAASSAATFATRSDEDGIAIAAFTFEHR
jgi:hypothetical protein